MKGYALRTFMAVAGSAVYLLQGYDQAVFNGLLTMDTFLKTFPETDTMSTTGALKAKNASMQGTVVAVFELGCAGGSLLCFLLGDWLGRKKMIQTMSFLAIIGALLQTCSFNVVQMVIARIITGLGVGGFSATIPMWLSECIDAKHRGRIILACGAFGDFGLVLASVVDLGTYFIKNSSVNWRLPIALQLVFAVSVCVMSFWLPESPRWLAKKGRTKEASETLATLRGDRGMDPVDPEVAAEITEIQLSLQPALTSKSGNRVLQRALLAIVLNISSTMSGINVLTFFSTSTFQNQLHFSAPAARALSAGLQAVQFLSACGSVWLIDRFGRRPLLLVAAAGMSISMALLCGLSPPSATSAMIQASLAFQFICMLVYPIGFHLIPTLYGAEISPTSSRHKITASASCLHWMFNFMLAEVTPIAFNKIHSWYYLVYMGTNTCTVFFVFLVCPETKGLSLEQIDRVFTLSKGPFDSIRVARRAGKLAQQVLDAQNAANNSKDPSEQRGHHENLLGHISLLEGFLDGNSSGFTINDLEGGKINNYRISSTATLQTLIDSETTGDPEQDSDWRKSDPAGAVPES